MSTTSPNVQSAAAPSSRFRVQSRPSRASVISLITPRTAEVGGASSVRRRVDQRLASNIHEPGMAHDASVADQHIGLTWQNVDVYPLFVAASLVVVATTAGLLVGGKALPGGHLINVFLIPVLICAVRWGLLPALAAALIGIGADRLVFEAHLFATTDLPEAIDIILFGIITAATCKLAGRLRNEMSKARSHEEEARRKDREISAVHRYSRRLMASGTISDVHSAILNYCSKELHARTFIIGASEHMAPELRMHDELDLPEAVRGQASRMLRGTNPRSQVVFDERTRRHWLVRLVSSRTTESGIVAADLGDQPPEAADALRRTIEAAIADAAAMVEHIEVSQFIHEAQCRPAEARPGTTCAGSSR